MSIRSLAPLIKADDASSPPMSVGHDDASGDTISQIAFESSECSADPMLASPSIRMLSSEQHSPYLETHSGFLPAEGTLPICFQEFRGLPFEIRLNIWRATLADARHVNINLVCPREHGAECATAPATTLTLALFINRESRKEALNYLCVVFPMDCTSLLLDSQLCKYCNRRPFALNTSIDSVSLDVGQEGAWKPEMYFWLLWLEVTRPELFKDVRLLEVRNCRFSLSGTGETALFLDPPYPLWMVNFWTAEKRLKYNILALFPNLKALYFTSVKFKKMDNPILQAMADEWELASGGCFEENARIWYEERLARVGEVEGKDWRHPDDSTCVRVVGAIATPRILARSWTEPSEEPFEPESDEEEI